MERGFPVVADLSCACCEENIPDPSKAQHDAQLEGLVCEPCRRNILWSKAWLKRAGIDRPIMVMDLTPQLKARFNIEQ